MKRESSFAVVFLIATCYILFIYGDESTRKCYGELGCLSLEGAFSDPKSLRTGPMLVLPWPRDRIWTTFNIFTRKDPAHAQILSYKEVTKQALKKTNFDPQKPLVMAVHGYLQTTILDDLPFVRIKDNALKNFDVNVVLVDWAKGSIASYFQAASNTRIVGAEMALFIKKLIEFYDYPVASIQLIGHSLGGHIVGYCGERVPRIGRITSLDPAEPLFVNTAPEVRIDTTDAAFVEVIHSDSTMFLASGKTGFGLGEPLGHIDFYPNGGSYNIFCAGTNAWHMLGKSGASVKERLRGIAICDHMHAVYITSSITFAAPNITQVQNVCLPLFYRCGSWEDYKEGKCSDCGEDLEKCAVFGLRSIEYFNKFKPKEPGVKMYSWTWMEHPACMHNYEMIISFGKTDVELIELFVQLEDVDGALSERRNIMSPHVGLLRMSNVNNGVLHTVVPYFSQRKYSKLKSLHIQWINFSKTGQVFNLKKISIFYMNDPVKTSEKPALMQHFCSSEDQKMKPYTVYALREC